MALFVAAPVDQEAVDWTVRYGDHPLVASYLLLYVGAFSVAMVEIARLSHRYAGFLPSGALRVGLRFTTVGASFGLAYCVYKAVYLIGRQAGLSVPDPVDWLARDDIIAPLLAAPGGVLVVIGLTLPSWAPPVGRVWQRPGLYRAYRDLYPLWRDLHDAEPDILFDEQMPAARPWREIGTLLERRAIEIPDGILRLTPYCDPLVEQQATADAHAAGLTGDPRLATVQAACITAALQAKAAGRRATTPTTPPSAKATTMEEQIAWLRLVGQAYRRHAGEREQAHHIAGPSAVSA